MPTALNIGNFAGYIRVLYNCNLGGLISTIEGVIFDGRNQSKLEKEKTMSQTIELFREFLTKHKNLFCSNCGTWTNHVLGRSFEYYACHCGEIIWIDLKETEDE